MKTLTTLGALVAMLAIAGSAHADGKDFAAACRESGDQVACTLAGVPLEASSPETTFELYAISCARHPDQCGPLVAYGQRLLKKRETARAVQALEKGCELRAPRACAVLAAELEEGERGIAQDVGKAARFHDKACELGASRSCALLAVLLDDGRGVRRDPARSQKLRARAENLDKPTAGAPPVPPNPSDDAQCRKTRDAVRCLEAGAAVQATDAVKAEELFRLGCGTDKTRCGLWAFALDRLRRDDPNRGMRLLEEGCVQGTGLACVVLADLHHTGFRAVPRDEARAAELYDSACTLGEPAGCRATAARYRGVRNAAKADELRTRAHTLEADADKPILALQESWLKDAAQSTAREPYLRELTRRRAEWQKQTQRSRSRWELRMQQLAGIDTGKEPESLPPAPPTDAQQSVTRTATIQRMAKALFP